MIGPSLIFDKSTLQSLDPDEAMWLDNFYTANITPLFFVETLADLEKEVRTGKTPEQIVGNLAHKSPEMGCVNTHHENLLRGELTGQGTIDMITGRPILSGGQAMKLGNETGIVFNEPPEIEAFKRWQKHQFLEIERTIAKKWREGLKSMDSAQICQAFQGFFDTLGKPKDLNELKTLVDRIIDNPKIKEILNFGLSVIGVVPEAREEVFQTWQASGGKPIREFAPYFVHVLSVDLFFYLGTAANLFSSFRHSQTHKVDIAYLYYLPFCKVFISNDKLHINISSFFMRPDQSFVAGEDFKNDLARLDQYYSTFSEEIKSRGVVSFAFTPPNDTSFLVTRLWDKYMSSTWRNIKTKKFDGTDKINPETEKGITEKITRFAKDAKPVDRNELGNSDDANSMLVKRMVSARKGKWRRFPPEIENSKKRLLD
jgi:hypothetical protein